MLCHETWNMKQNRENRFKWFSLTRPWWWWRLHWPFYFFPRPLGTYHHYISTCRFFPVWYILDGQIPVPRRETFPLTKDRPRFSQTSSSSHEVRFYGHEFLARWLRPHPETSSDAFWLPSLYALVFSLFDLLGYNCVVKLTTLLTFILYSLKLILENFLIQSPREIRMMPKIIMNKATKKDRSSGYRNIAKPRAMVKTPKNIRAQKMRRMNFRTRLMCTCFDLLIY